MMHVVYVFSLFFFLVASPFYGASKQPDSSVDGTSADGTSHGAVFHSSSLFGPQHALPAVKVPGKSYRLSEKRQQKAQSFDSSVGFPKARFSPIWKRSRASSVSDISFLFPFLDASRDRNEKGPAEGFHKWTSRRPFVNYDYDKQETWLPAAPDVPWAYKTSLHGPNPNLKPAQQLPDKFNLGRLEGGSFPSSRRMQTPLPDLGSKVKGLASHDLKSRDSVSRAGKDDKRKKKRSLKKSEGQVERETLLPVITWPRETVMLRTRIYRAGRGGARRLIVQVDNPTKWVCSKANLLVRFPDKSLHKEKFTISHHESIEIWLSRRDVKPSQIEAAASCSPKKVNADFIPKTTLSR